MIAGSIILSRALQPVEQAISGWKQVSNARAAKKRLHEFLNRPERRPAGLPLPPPAGRLVVDNLFFKHANSQKPVLKGVSFDARPGEAVAVIGPSAAGKSTLARLLVGLHPPSSGTVRLDGAEIFNWHREDIGRLSGLPAAGCRTLLRHGRGEHRAPAHAGRFGRGRRGAACRLPRHDPAAARRLRHRDRRRRRHAVGRSAAAHRAGAGALRKPEAGDPGRAERQPRHRRRRCPQSGHRGPERAGGYRRRDRSPSQHAVAGGAHPGAARWPGRHVRTPVGRDRSAEAPARAADSAPAQAILPQPAPSRVRPRPHRRCGSSRPKRPSERDRP